MFSNATIFIGGGTGSWGRELTRQLLLQNPRKVIIFSRGEIAQVDMERTFRDYRLKFVIGDIRDKDAVNRAMQGVDYVFQLAALKHVPVCENQPIEAILTNIYGMMNVIDAAIKNKVKKFIDVSTDKCANPINTYGLTKSVGERLTIQANCETKDTDFICIRGGNVLGTNGSLVPFVIKQIKEGVPVKVTDDTMTRFFLSLPQAIKLLLFASEKGIGGETYVMKMPSFKIIDLINVLINHYDPSAKIEITGIREGEKIHEVLVSEHEVNRSYLVSSDYMVIRPQLNTGRMYLSLDDKLTEPYSSDRNLASEEVLVRLLKDGGWLS